MAFPHHDPADLRPPLHANHAHARDALDSYGGYGVDDLGDKPHSPFHGIDSPRQVSAPALALPSGFCVGLGTSSRRRRRSASPQTWPRAADISYAPYHLHRPSPPSPAPHQEHHQRARGESSRSPRFHSSSNRTKQSRLEAGHEDSSSVRCRRRYEEPECVRDHHEHGTGNTSPLHHSPSRMSLPVDSPPLDDGSKSPTDWPDSPIHCYEHYNQMIKFGHNGQPDSTWGAYDGSGITDRDPGSIYGDHSYNGLVDDFMDAAVDNWREPDNFDQAEKEELYRKQTKRFAELALKRYNKNNKVKYSLVEAIDGAIFFERDYFHAHVNFYANAINGPKKNGPKVFVFAELEHVGRRLNAMALRSSHFLDEKKQTVGRRYLARGSHTSQDRDIYHCYACTDAIKHPEGSGYKAGHFLAVSCILP
ncbi:hypothetical protein ACQ4PT_022858 [Festuca glaucescens]